MDFAPKKDLAQLFQAIKDDITSMDEGMFTPGEEVHENDVIHGELPTELRKFYAVLKYKNREIDQLKVELKYANEEPTKKRIAMEMNHLHVYTAMLLRVFWLAVYEHFQLWEPTLTAEADIRKGWQVVTHEQQAASNVFRQIFGGNVRGGIINFPFGESDEE